MSGRKNFNHTVTESRRAAEQALRTARAAQRAAERREREARILAEREAAARKKTAEVKQRLAEARRQTQDRIAVLTAERTREITDQQLRQRQKNEARVTESAENNRAAVKDSNQSAKEDLVKLATDLGVPTATLSELTGDDTPLEMTTRLIDACEEQQQLNDEFDNNTGNLRSWLDTLQNSEEVKHFAGHRLQPWLAVTSELLSVAPGSRNTRQRLTAVQDAILQAEQIEAEAIEVSEKFEQRNSVLKDILESLQEVGFFVQDPEFLDPTRPDQAVIIRANRADQTMEAKVELDASVESDWQGIHGEYCTDAFFEYVKQMNQRGVEITSDNPQLEPVLKQQNALNLPTANEHRSGNE